MIIMNSGIRQFPSYNTISFKQSLQSNIDTRYTLKILGYFKEFEEPVKKISERGNLNEFITGIQKIMNQISVSDYSPDCLKLLNNEEQVPVEKLKQIVKILYEDLYGSKSKLPERKDEMVEKAKNLIICPIYGQESRSIVQAVLKQEELKKFISETANN